MESNALWHSLLFRRIFLDSDQMQKVMECHGAALTLDEWGQGIGGTLANDLRRAGFLAKPDDDERMVRNQVEKPVQIQGLYLVLATDCNLDCSYCLYRAGASQSLAGDRNMSRMSPKVAVEGVDCFAEAVRGNHRNDGYWQQITFYGGEPLLNLGALHSAVERIRALRDDGELWDGTGLVINTNGILLTEQIVRFLVLQGIEVQISVDGFSSVHDLNRKTRNGQGSFSRVTKKLDLLRSFGASVRPLITVTEDNIVGLPDFVTWLCATYGITQYAFNLLMSGTGTCAADYPTRAAKAMRDTVRATEVIGATDPALSEIIGGFAGPAISGQSCGGGRKITVFPSGQLHACQALEASGVSLVSELPSFDIESAAFQTWKRRSRFNDETCLACPALGNCGGGCAAGSFHTGGDIHSVDPNNCQWTLALYDLRNT